MMIGVGAVYCYDAIGSYERENYRANGSAAALIQPFLDNQVWILTTRLGHEQELMSMLITRSVARTCKTYHINLWNWNKF